MQCIAKLSSTEEKYNGIYRSLDGWMVRSFKVSHYISDYLFFKTVSTATIAEREKGLIQ